MCHPSKRKYPLQVLKFSLFSPCNILELIFLLSSQKGSKRQKGRIYTNKNKTDVQNSNVKIFGLNYEKDS